MLRMLLKLQSAIQMSALELLHCPCANNEIFVKKTIQSIFLENKCKMSEKQLEQLANPYAFNLKKSRSLIGHFLLRVSKLVRNY